MKNICFVSNAFNHLFENNTNTQFQSSIQLSYLDYLTPMSDDIEFCVKSISFYLEEPLSTAGVYGLRSSLCREPIMFGSTNDNVVCMFTIEKTHHSTEVIVTVNNSIFHLTTKNHLSQAYFEIINLKTNTVLPSSNVKPSVIEINIKDRSFTRMHPPFTMLLHSDESKSLENNPINTNMKFTIELGKIMELSSNWTAVLKGLSMTSKIFNVQDDSFSLIFVDYYTVEGHIGHIDDEKNMVIKNYSLPPDYYSNVTEMIDKLNQWMKQEKISIQFSTKGRNSLVNIQNTSTESYHKNRRIYLNISRNLSIALGCDIKNEMTYYPIQQKNYSCERIGNINIGIPTNIILKCDLIAITAVGNRKVKMLRHITNFNNKLKNSIMNFQFRDVDPCVIETKSFSKISFEFCTIDDKLILARNDVPSFVHILFVNI